MQTPDTPPVTITYCDQTGTITKAAFDLLIVACDPRGLPLSRTDDERAVFDGLTNFTFHTYALKVKVPTAAADKPAYGIILRPPGDLSDMDGKVYGFRNETAKQFTLAAANVMEENLVVAYRLWSRSLVDVSPAHDERDLRDLLGQTEWWPYGDEFEILGRFATPYFDHFDVEGVKNGLPWTYLGLQGQNATFYVHASTCFESALTIRQYLDLLFKDRPAAGGVPLPSDKTARICVLGAGVSGLLVTKWLQDAQYTNITVLERNPLQVMTHADVYGKTVSLVFDEPAPPAGVSPYSGPTVCELGTCYMSPAYDTLVQSLVEWTGVEMPRGFECAPGHPGEFRGIVVPGPDGKPMVTPFTRFIYDAARAHIPGEPSDKDIEIAIAWGAAVYAYEQFEVMKAALPMPLSQPPGAVMGQTYAEFLDKTFPDQKYLRPMRLLDGVLQYTYSIQGYGPLNGVSAFYGLVWITAELVFDDALKILKDPLVTFWPGGWGQVWERLSAGMPISYGTTVLSITRAGT